MELIEIVQLITGHHESNSTALHELREDVKQIIKNQKRVEAKVNRLLELAEPRAMSLDFKERTMPIDTQEFSLHPDKVTDVVGATADASVTLTNLAFTPATSLIGVDSDSDTSDDSVAIDSGGISVGATDTLTFTADGSDGKKYEAIGHGTVVAADVVFEPMNLVFTERA